VPVGYHWGMVKLLMNLRGVPDDETDEIRSLLEAQKIAFYETEPSPWGVSGGGIWIRHDEDTARAQRLLADYQVERRTRARAEYSAAKRDGTMTTIWISFRENPLRAIAVLIGAGLLIAVLALPFLMLGG
jgi:hypothetical protein